MLRVIIADDHPLIREGLKSVLMQDHHIHVVAEAKNSLEVMSLMTQHMAQVLLLDINMPGNRELELIPKLKNKYAKLAILLLSVHPEERYALRALKLGIDGYLTKECAATELVHAVRTISSGKKYISPQLAETLATQWSQTNDSPIHDSLSQREFQIMCLIASGKSIKEIATEISLSQSTLNTYRSRIMEKLHINNNVDLCRYAIRHGIIDS